jgi:hypothetical protein
MWEYAASEEPGCDFEYFTRSHIALIERKRLKLGYTGADEGFAYARVLLTASHDPAFVA